MFTQSVTSPPTGPQNTSPTPSARPSRLRGLTYLRNYTHNHLLSRDHGTASNSSPARSASHLTRSVSYEPSSSAQSRNANRLTLVSSTPDRSQPRSQPQRSTTAPTQQPPDSPSSSNASPVDNDTTAIVNAHASDDDSAGEGQANMTRTRASSGAEGRSASPESVPSIRLSAYYDPRSTRPSLTFSPVSRTLPNHSDVIRVGRYSERDNQAMANQPGNSPSAAPVGFKSKVVSRRHCEFWCEDGKWFIKDVKSSSGTFLNHIRLSPPSQESKAFPINDGDIVQLGIDFKGGEEMIFRCVKMRIELNRGWQNKLNTFNMAAHKRLRNMADTSTAETGNTSQDCSICLNSIAPCQSLFVAPCSHTWHFKCVRSLLTAHHSVFVCPNCRAGADLDADVEEVAEDWEQMDVGNAPPGDRDEADVQAPNVTNDESERASVHDSDAMDVTVNITAGSPASDTNNATSQPVPICSPVPDATRMSMTRDNRTPSPPGNGAEGPITPSNDAGPWVFDGSAGRAGRATSGAGPGMGSLDAAADMTMTSNSGGDDSN